MIVKEKHLAFPSVCGTPSTIAYYFAT